MSAPITGLVATAISASDSTLASKVKAAAAVARQARKDNPERIQEAATQFEALLIAQMLRQVREAGSGGLIGDSENKSGEHLMGFAEEQLAQVLSANGGLGIARMAAGSFIQQPAYGSVPNAHSPTTQPAKLNRE